MKNELALIKKHGQVLADSRDVAGMVEKRHDHLIRDIKGYVEILSNTENPTLGSQNFFIPSTYKTEGNNKIYDCYLITKMGCDMIANKMIGEKG